MTLIIFIIILGILILVHELGHFLTAKKAGVHVEEFGIGYPPRAINLGKKWGTIFSLNWIPFGGFVKILGENYEKEKDEPKENLKNEKRFIDVNKKWQALILAGGVLFNIIFAWILLSFGFFIGIPAPVENNFGGTVIDPKLTIVSVLQDSPAENVGLKTGDQIVSISSDGDIPLIPETPEEVSVIVGDSEEYVLVQIDRGGEIFNYEIIPKDILNDNSRMIGVQMDMIGTLTLPPHKAIYEGAKTTFTLTHLTVRGLFNFFKDAFRGEADMSQITGPVGIVGLVGDASKLGFSYLLTFTALISINLAIINLIPFPALDGGRLLFVAIEAITKKPINQKFASVANTIGFAILIFLMLVVTYRDIVRLF